MATELRKIDFNLDELHLAVSIYAEKANKPMPKGEILSVSADLTGRLQFDYSAGDTLIILEKDFLIALLLLCRQHKIPVARDARKALKTEGNQVSLMLRR